MLTECVYELFGYINVIKKTYCLDHIEGRQGCLKFVNRYSRESSATAV